MGQCGQEGEWGTSSLIGGYITLVYMWMLDEHGDGFIGVNLSEPHTHERASPVIYVSMYVSIYKCIVHHSVNNCPHVLIHQTALILQCIANSVNATTFK